MPKGLQQVLSVHHTGSGAELLFSFYQGPVGEVENSTLLHTGEIPAFEIHPDVPTTYWARAQEPNGCYADTPQLTVDVCAPQIVTQPLSALIVANATARLEVMTDLGDSPRLQYEWYIGAPGDISTAVPGGDTRAIDVSPSTDTTYWVRIISTCSTGDAIQVDSAAATVSVCAPPAITEQPIPANGVPGIPVALRVVATGTDLSYQWYRGPVNDTSDPVASATSANLSIEVSQTTDFWVRITGHCGAVNSNSARVSVAPAITTQLVGGPVTKGITRTLTVAASGTYLAYEWYLGSPGTATLIGGATTAFYTTPALLTDATYWVRVQSGAQYVDSAPATFTVCQPRTAAATYSTKVSGSAVTLQANAPAPDETFEWYRGAQGETATPVGNGTYVSVSPIQTTDYWVRTKRPTCDADSPTVLAVVCIPSITTQPQSGSALSGSTATLTVAATGTGPLTYQWYSGTAGDTSQPVSTSASYTTPALTTSRTYWVRVSSPVQTGCGGRSVDSQAATITICNVPAISAITGNQKTVSGSPVTLSVSASGGSLLYEWHEDAVGSGPVIGTSSSISVAPTATTRYWVRVYNGCGTVNSIAIDVSVYPVITVQPMDTCACSTATVRFSLTATGSGLSYVWYRQYSGQAAQVVGGNNPYVDITATANATVSCAVTSGSATTASNEVTLNVLPPPADYTLTKAVYSATQWRLTATVDPLDEYSVEYEWYRGALGDTSNRISVPVNSYLIVVTPPSRPMTYWVRVRYIDTGCWKDKAITIQ